MTQHDLDTAMLAQVCAMATTSLDPSTQNCAALLLPGTSELAGFSVNRFPYDVENLPGRWNDKAAKYERVVHSEKGTVAWAARHGVKTEGATMYCLWATCGPCAGMIIQSGINRLVARSYDNSKSTWGSSIAIGFEMLAEAGIEVTLIEGPIMPEDFTLRQSGREYRP